MANTEWPTPGLKWRSRAGGQRVPYWYPSQAAIKAGYPGAAVNLQAFAAHPEIISQKCVEYQTDMALWLDGVRRAGTVYDGTVRSILQLYQTHERSGFHQLKPGSRAPYSIYLRKLEKHPIADRHVTRISGLDIQADIEDWGSGGRFPAAGKTCFKVLLAAVTFACLCDITDAFTLREKLRLIRVAGPRPRTANATAKQVGAARAAAHANGAPSRALAYALQFETTMRQWDVAGQWFPLEYPLASGILGPAGKWSGLLWSHIDQHNILRYRPSKTDKSSGAEITIDLNLCPMVLDEIARVPAERRSGPMIVYERTSRPYTQKEFARGWKSDRKAAGLPETLWSRDLRASGVTEAREAGASTDDASKVAGHSTKATTGRVYDRANLQAAQRFQQARIAHRKGRPE